MLDDRVASIARRRLKPEAGEHLRELPLLPLARAPGSAAEGATTPTETKWSPDCAGAPPLGSTEQRPHERGGGRDDRWRQVRTRMRRLLRGDGGGSGEKRGEKRGGRPVTMLHRDFWLEALDDQHRYGCYLRAFHKAWKLEASGQDAIDDDGGNASFFCWLDHGDGRALDLPECSHDELRRSRVVYCSYEERRRYELRFVAPSEARRVSSARRNGTSAAGEAAGARGCVAEYAESHALAHTDERSKWIFVVDLGGRMYLGRKRKGRFHHSSFVAGAPVVAAGKIVIKLGRVLAIEPHSGHFKPKLASLGALRGLLARQGVDVDAVTFVKPKKWAGEWPFPALEESVDLDDFASDTDDGGSNAFFGRPDAVVGDDDDEEVGDEDERWPPASP